MNDPIRRNEQLRVGVSHEPVVRVVLAGADAPDSLRYLLDAEGFLVIGCASDETQLARLLRPGLDPDVVVLDTDISVPSVLLARERAPSAQVIVLWPDDVQRLPGTERIAPWRVYEQLGPAIRRALHERPQPLAISDPVTEQPLSDAPVTRVADAPPARAASRISITTVALIAVLMLTMGAAFAMESFHVRLPWAAPRTGGPAPPQTGGPAVPQTSGPNVLRPTPAADRPLDGPSPREEGSCQRTSNGIPNTHASANAAAAHARMCSTGGDPGNEPQHPGNAGDAGKNDQPGPSDHPGRDDHPGGKPDGVGSGGSSHDSGGTPKDEPGNTHPGPPTDPGDTGHGPH